MLQRLLNDEEANHFPWSDSIYDELEQMKNSVAEVDVVDHFVNTRIIDN